jgi:hypothetical protein
MTVPVVVADGHQPEPRVQRAVEGRALVGRTVVRDFDDIRLPDRTGRGQRLLLVLTEIAEKESGERSAPRLHDQAPRVPGEL